MNLTTNTSLALIQQAQSPQAQAQATAPKNAVTKEDKTMAQIDAVAQDFEAMFVTELMRPMFAELKPDPIFGGGKGEEIFQGMMLEEYGRMMAETGQLGIADQVKAELIRMQSGQTILPAAEKNTQNPEPLEATNVKTADPLSTIIKELNDE